MKVGLITYGLDRPLTGIGRYTLELARAMVRLGDGPDVALLAAGGLGPLAEELAGHVPLRGCRLLPGLMMVGNVAIPLAARRLGLEVVHDPTGVAPFALGAGGARRVVTVHDVFAWSYPGTSTRLDTLIQRYWLPRVLRRVDAIITDSGPSKADLVRHLHVEADNIQVIHPGVSEGFRPSSPQELARVRAAHTLPERYILFVGSVERRKNLAGLVRAYAQYVRRGGKEALVVAGPAWRGYPELASALGELALEDRVRFIGYVSENDLPALYGGAALFVFPSLYEGFGLPPLEAMACGTPVVCSNAASLPEVVGDAALLVDPADVEGLAETMERVLSDADLAGELRERGLARAAGFTWERTARETLAVYREVCGGDG